jgi:hypothetical protein
MSAFDSRPVYRQFLAYQSTTTPVTTLTANGGVTSILASRLFTNIYPSQIHIRLRNIATGSVPATLRATIFSVASDASSLVQSAFSAYCDLPLANSGAIRRTGHIAFYAMGENINAVNSINTTLFNGTAVSGVVDVDGKTISPSSVQSYQIVSASASCLIPNRFRILLQNMDSVNSIMINNLEIYFVV